MNSIKGATVRFEVLDFTQALKRKDGFGTVSKSYSPESQFFIVHIYFSFELGKPK